MNEVSERDYDLSMHAGACSGWIGLHVKSC